MQKKNTGVIMQLIKSMQYEKWINFRFIGLLFVAFLLQHLSFATLQKSYGVNNPNSCTVQNSYFEKSNSNQHDYELAFFIEVASEDEDEIQNEQVVHSELFSDNQSFNALHYSTATNTLFLRLASSIQHKVDLPFFILFHSWKSDLA